MWKWQLGGLLVGAGIMFGCDGSHPSPHSPSQQRPAVASVSPNEKAVVATTQWELSPPKSVTAGKTNAPHDPGAVFMHYCSVCHGPEGRGDGQFYSDELSSKPANLTDQPAMALLSDEQLTSVITLGSAAVGKSPLCPPWGRVFSKEQVVELVAYVRTLPTRASQVTPEGQEDQK